MFLGKKRTRKEDWEEVKEKGEFQEKTGKIDGGFPFRAINTENYWEKKANNDPANIKMGIGRCGRIIGALADWHDCEISSLPSSH